MAVKDLINIGLAPDSGTGDSARRGGEKINNLFADIYANFGDNPIGNDPSGPFYGFRRPFYEYEYKVGELHPAGKYSTVRFKDTTTPAAFDSDFGYGVDNVGTFVDTNSDGIPDIYRDSEWYFLSRGEAVAADLSELSAGEVAHIVLPLAKAGDIVKVRDSFNTWGGKFISVWTTPYEFQTVSQVTEWKDNTPFNTKTYPDSDSVSIAKADGSYFATPYKRPVLPAAVTTAHPLLSQKFDFYTTGTLKNLSRVYFYDRENTELEFMYRGPDIGWVVKERLLLSSFEQIDILQDNFTEADWIEWDTTDLTVTIDNAPEVEISVGSYVLCVAPQSGAGRLDLKSSTAPVTKVYRRMTDDPTSTEAIDQLRTFFRAKITQDENFTGDVRNRIEAILGEDSDGTSVSDGFVQTDATNLYKEITLSKITDTSGNIVLVSQRPFDGFVQILAPTS